MMDKQQIKTKDEKVIDLTFTTTMEELQTGISSKPEFFTGKIIEGKVSEKRTDGALIDIGYKTEGFIPTIESLNWESISRGDTISVYCETSENENCMPVLSVRKVQEIMAWERITSKYSEGSIIKGLMKHRVKGGFIVDIQGVEAFLPGSQIDVGQIRNMNDYIGNEYDVKIIKINHNRRNILVSRRALLEQQKNYNKSSKNISSSWDLGVLYMGLGNYDLAEKEFSAVLDHNPFDAKCLLMRGKNYLFNKQYDRAIAAMNSAITQDTSLACQGIEWLSQAYIQRAALYYKQKEYAKALEDLQHILNWNIEDLAVIASLMSTQISSLSTDFDHGQLHREFDKNTIKDDESYF